MPPPPNPHGTNVLSIATLNINGITALTRVGMLAEFIRTHDFDIIFLQEVTNPDVFRFRGYETYMNIGTSMRGTAIVAKVPAPTYERPHSAHWKRNCSDSPWYSYDKCIRPIGQRTEDRKGTDPLITRRVYTHSARRRFQLCAASH
jgi:exonuclease III